MSGMNTVFSILNPCCYFGWCEDPRQNPSVEADPKPPPIQPKAETEIPPELQQQLLKKQVLDYKIEALNEQINLKRLSTVPVFQWKNTRTAKAEPEKLLSLKEAKAKLKELAKLTFEKTPRRETF